MISPEAANAFLSQPRITVVGASDDRSNFGGTVYRALRDHGVDVVPVHPTAATVAGDLCHPDLASVPDLGAVLVMVNPAQAIDVVRTCLDRGVDRIWLFKGLGGPGAVSSEALQLCEERGVDVIAGACPLMFLEPVGLPHRVHRVFRRLNGSLAAA